MRIMVFAVCFTFITIPQISVAGDFDWTGWLGPNRDGWVKEFRPPAAWPKTLERKWRVPVGEGYGSPLVVGDRVFQHGRQGEDEAVFCLKLDSGETVWRKSYRAPFKIGGGGERHGKGPKSCPTYANGRVFTLSITGTLAAWNADDGSLLWERDDSAKFKSGHPYWGVSTSPIVDGDRVVVHFGTDEGGLLTAIDSATGEDIWTLGDDGPSYSSPLLVTIAGVRQIVEWNHENLVGVDSRTGTQLWSYPMPHVGSDQNMPTPTFHRGRILLGAENRGIRSVEPIRDGDKWTAKERWLQKELALDMASAVINDGFLYGLSHYDRGRFFCLDPDSGKMRWTGPPRQGNNATFLAVRGYVIALTNRGEVKVMKATPGKYELAAEYDVSDTPTWAPPVLLQSGLLVKDLRTLTFWAFPDAK